MYSFLEKRKQAKPRKIAVIRKSMKIANPSGLGSSLNIRKENLPDLGAGSKDFR